MTLHRLDFADNLSINTKLLSSFAGERVYNDLYLLAFNLAEVITL
jgi:hypothetical protein